MSKFTAVVFVALVILTSLGGLASAQSTTPIHPRKKVITATHAQNVVPHSVYDRHGTTPWDFSGMLSLYSPGFAIGGLAAYRLTDNLLPKVDQSLSVESGVNAIFVNDNYGGASVSYSLIEIPVQARWDFYFDQGKFLVGPRAGFNFLAGSSNVTVNGTSYSINRGGGVYFQLGASGMYYFNPQWAVRAIIELGGYTTLALGLNYAL